MSLSHSTLADIDINESISYEMHLSDSNDINFSDDFSDTSSSRYTNGEIKPRIGDISIIIQYHIKYKYGIYHIISMTLYINA
jgi:hypothetical protein